MAFPNDVTVTATTVDGNVPRTLKTIEWLAAQPIPAGSATIGGVTQVGTWTFSLPTGAATDATLTALSAKLPASLGIKTAANSLSMVPASDATFAATQSGTWNIGSITTLPALPAGTNAIGKLAANAGVTIGAVELAGGQTLANITNITGTISLPTGASTAANQTTANGYLATIAAAAADTTTESPVTLRQPADVITVTPTMDTSAYASGDTFFTATSFTAVRANDQRSLLQSLTVIDKDDQKPAFTLFFFSANVTFGTINAAPSISDSDAANFLGSVAVAAADYSDLGGVSVACIKNIGLLLESVSSASTVYVAGMLTAGTPTHTAAGLVLRLGLLHT